MGSIGCFGNSAEDRSRGAELDRYLDSFDDKLGKQVTERQQEVLDDMAEFEQYMMYGYEGFFAISRQLNRALCLAGKTDDASMLALHDAMREMRSALDAHIENTVRTLG